MVVLDIGIAGVIEFQPSVVKCDLSSCQMGGISLLGFQESEHAARQIASRRFKKREEAYQRRRGVVEITHGPGGGGFEAQRRRHNACDTWEWIVPPKKYQVPPDR